MLSLSGAVLGGAGAPSNASLSFTLADVFPAPALAAGSLPAAAAAAPAHALFGALYLAVLLPLSLVQFIMNSWISMGWAHWPVVRRLRGASPAADALLVAPARAVAGLQRALVQLRLVHAYGVFPPTVAPPQRWTVCFETSDDGRRWARLRYAHQTSSPASAPSFVAPWHPRLDHAVFYESTGMNGQNLLAPLGHHSPLSFPASSTAWSRVQARLLQGSPSVRALFADPPPAGAPPPRFVRAVLCEFSPAPAADAARGVHWREVVAGVHLPPASLASIQAASLGVPGGGLLPFADAAPAGVHDYWCESAVWAGRALAASGPPRPPTDDELDALWRFLDFVRAAAVEAAAAGTGAWRKAGRDGGGGILVVGGGGGEGGQPGGGRSTAAPGTVRRRSGSGAAAAAAPPRGSPRAQPPARATAPAAAAAAAPAARPPVSELSDAACALGAPAEAYHAGLPARSLAEARAIYTWRALPAVVDAVRRLYTPGALVALRHTLGRVALPLLRASDAAFGRAPPPAAGARDAAAAAAAAELRELIEGTPPDVSVPRDGEFDAAGVPAARARATAHVFRGNDDADARGAAANPLRWLAHAHVLALVGGRAGVRAVHEGLAAAAGAPAGGVASRAFYERLAAAGGAGARERGALLRALSAGASGAGERVRHGDVPTESGLFLAFLLHYDVVVAHAEGAARTAAQARPPPAHGAVRPRAEDAPTFLPAALAVLPRLLAHHRVLRRAGGGGPPPARPAWAFDEPEGRWERVRPTQSRVE